MAGRKEPLSIVVAHNYYQWRGGEDQIFEDESALLESKGHKITRYSLHNDQVSELGPLSLALGTVWRRSAARELRVVLRRAKADLVHFHNTFPLISPAAYYAAAAEGVPVFQTLQNYRITCSAATLLRNGAVCEKCVGTSIPWAGVRHRCYRGSLGASSATAAMSAVHRVLGTWNSKVQRYIAPSQFVKDKLTEGGLPSSRVVVKPNFVMAARRAPDRNAKRNSAVFVGRLSVEKGVQSLISAVEGLNTELTVIGDGPLMQSLRQNCGQNVRLLGHRPMVAILEAVANAEFLVAASIWHEPFGLVVVEAFSQGTPVIASRVGAFPEIVEEGVTGLFFEPNNVEDLAKKIRWAEEHPEEMAQMGKNARKVYEEKYTPQKNYAQLVSIYEDVIRESSRHRKNWSKEPVVGVRSS